ncbi:MAG: hypothetical protein QOG67_177 [Verrucomicrobiota bacterium]|jgi:hypothetical protein
MTRSYHFGTGSTVDAQVEHYLKTARLNDNELVCLDFEENPTGPSMSLTQAREFVALFQFRTGRLPILYGGHWLKEKLKGNPMICLHDVRSGWRSTQPSQCYRSVGKNTHSGNTPTAKPVRSRTTSPALGPATGTNSTAPSLSCESNGHSHEQ